MISVKKGMFSKIIVIFCVLEMAFLQIWAMRIASHNSFLTTPLLTANHAVFGGELLLLCLKRLLTDDKILKNSEETKDKKETEVKKKKIKTTKTKEERKNEEVSD